MADQAPRPTPVPATPLVGRERERAALREALDHALGGQGSLVLIGGEAGIGKTALAEVTLAEAAERGALVLVGRCYDLSEVPPYGPWRELFERAPREGLPALPSAVLLVDGEGAVFASQEAIVARMRAYLAALAAAQPLALLLEDLHWADPASTDLLRVVGRHLVDIPVLLLGTYRADEVRQEHPLFALLPLLVREARAARLDLRPLDRGAIGALVAGRYILGAADQDRLADYLTARTEGNALFLGELLRTLEGEDLLRPEGRAWVVGDLAAAPVPALLRQLIAGRAVRLAPETARLLAVAAVVGQEVPLALWAAVGEVAEGDLLDHAERALDARLLTEVPNGMAVRFAHALIREALYEQTPALRRRALHRRAGEALAALPGPDPDAVADHFRRAGDPRATVWLVRAGERAQRAYAWISAAARFEAALALLQADTSARRECGWLHYRLGILLQAVGAEPALAAMDAALEVAAAVGDPALAAYARYMRGGIGCGFPDRRQGLVDLAAGVAALAARPADAPIRLAALGDFVAAPSIYDEYNPPGMLVLHLAMAGRYAEARTLGEANVAGAAAQADLGPMQRAAYGDTYFGLAALLAGLGQPEAARVRFAQAREAYRAIDHPDQLSTVRARELTLLTLPYRADRPAERRQVAAEAARAAARASAMSDVPAGLASLPVLFLEGRWAAILRVVPRATAGRWFFGVPAQLARAQGDVDRAWDFVRVLLPDGPDAVPGGAIYPNCLLAQQVAVALALEGGDLALARRWLAAHDRWLTWAGAVHGRAEGALGWAAYHRAVGDLPRARQDAEAALAHATEPRQPLALLAAHRLLGELDTAAGGYTAAERHLAEALALTEACAAPYEGALTLLGRAALGLAILDHAATVSALDEARALLVPLEARPALARADTLAARLADLPAAAGRTSLPSGLTAREAEVLRLLAEGLPDAAIAARLFVSRHTVNAHTKAIYGKLGVASRGAAVRLARERGLA